MPYNPNIHHRRSIRLKGYDYSQAGLYFVTINVQDRKHLFGKIVNGEMIINDAGQMVETEWLALPERFQNIELHEFIVMPDHFHGILEIKGQPQGIVPTSGKTVGDMMDAFKSIVTVEYIRGVKTLGWKPFNGKLWQHNYYEHIIRDEQSYQNISDYIRNNPSKWQDDKFFQQ